MLTLVETGHMHSLCTSWHEHLLTEFSVILWNIYLGNIPYLQLLLKGNCGFICHSFLQLFFLFVQYPILATLQPLASLPAFTTIQQFRTQNISKSGSYNAPIFMLFKHFFSQVHLFLNSWKIWIIRRCLFQKCTEAYFSSSFGLHFLNSEFLMKLCTTQSAQGRKKDFFFCWWAISVSFLWFWQKMEPFC